MRTRRTTTTREEARLLATICQGERREASTDEKIASLHAWQHLLDRLQPQLIAIATHYRSWCTPERCPPEALLLAAQRGLLDALRAYQARGSRPVPFATYAQPWIRAAIHHRLGFPGARAG